MNPMDEAELRKIDGEIARRLFGWKSSPLGNMDWQMVPPFPFGDGSKVECCPRFTTNPADAMAVLKRCAEKVGDFAVCVSFDGSTWTVTHSDKYDAPRAEAPTLETAICKFALKLFP